MKISPGQLFRDAMSQESPLIIVGAMNAYVALMAKNLGIRALYLSGANVANSSYGIPDLGITSLENVLEDVGRILSTVNLPLLVDVDTGWGNELSIARTVKLMAQAGVAAIHIEDQISNKKCGHRPEKKIVPTEEMVKRIQSAVETKNAIQSDIIIIARTDALANEGLNSTIDRALAYKAAGAEMLFPEAVTQLEEYKAFKNSVGIPILANITEFGKTPLFTKEELAAAGVDLMLFPLTINRCMNHAAELALKEIRQKGTQKDMIPSMQTREELYHFLNYHALEQKLK